MTSQKDIQTAVQILNQGGLVAFPTETVYGLGADASNPEALRKIFAAKQRPIDHPLIVHVASSKSLSQWVSEVPESAERLAEAFWPGPLTLILKKALHVSPIVTGNQDTIGLRVPHHAIALDLLKAFGGGLAAPSANRFGRISPTTAEAVREELGTTVNLVLDGGQCEVGVESTIVDVSGEHPVILRPGMITAQQIEAVLKKSVGVGKKESPRVSGSMESHYAPRTPTILMSSVELMHFIKNRKNVVLPCAVLSYSQPSVVESGVKWVSMSSDPQRYAHDLYQMMRDLDKDNLCLIIVEAIPDGQVWDAVRDRLQRATAK